MSGDWFERLEHSPECNFAFLREFVAEDSVCSCLDTVLSVVEGPACWSVLSWEDTRALLRVMPKSPVRTELKHWSYMQMYGGLSAFLNPRPAMPVWLASPEFGRARLMV